MLKNKKIACIIPARLASTRFPRKMLATILGKPLLEWVWIATQQVKHFDYVGFAIDSQETEAIIKKITPNYIMTSPECPSGTDRIIEVLNTNKIEADIWVNWQGDEPFISPAMIDTLLQSIDNPSNKPNQIWTLKKKICNENEIPSPNFAKVVCDINDNALYFSRSAIPFYREPLNSPEKTYYKHVGIYAYTPQALKEIEQMAPSPLEDAEKLEQLRYIQNGLSIKIHETNEEVIGIDIPEHLEAATERMRKQLGL
ncbi:MAG: 3-deoxy-manno-octulosonate cytidylyltransferase [bacterium]